MADFLRSDRLTLRRLVPDDAVHFARLLGHDSESVQMMATMPDPCTEEAARGWIEMRTSSGHVFAITRTDDEEFLGCIGFGGQSDTFHLGYWIGRPYWGQGYVTEAVRAVIKFARSPGYTKMKAETLPNNPASARVLEKVGFRKVGNAMVDTPLRGGPCEVNQYELELSQTAMKIAIVGYGKMGRMIEQAAVVRGHEIIARFDIDNNANGEGLTRESLAGVDAAIEFSTPETALINIRRLAELRVPMVVGTTGWHAQLDEVKALIAQHEASLVYGANFSVGVNLFFKIAHYAAELFSRYDAYDPFLIEHHHRFKKDAPSGTALVIEKLLRESYGERTPQSASVRAGHIPGTHEIGFDSEADTVTLAHVARSRQGFATGAVVAAEKIVGRRGFYEFSELLFEQEQAGRNL